MPRKWVLTAGLATAAVVIAGVAFGLAQSSTSKSPAQSSAPLSTGPIHLDSTFPQSGETNVDGAGEIAVNFSEPLAGNSPRPMISPSVPGSWSTVGDSLVFTPQTAFEQATKVTVTIPGGPDGVRSNGGGLLTDTVTEHFTTGAFSQTRLAQIFAQLGYLPLSWNPAGDGATKAEAAFDDQNGQSQIALAYSPPPGTFAWKDSYPATLTSQWNPDQANALLKGAVMAFQSEHGMTVNGNLTSKLWNALFTAMAQDQQNKNGYTYAVASKSTPETLTIWHNGREVLHTLANTGIGVEPTVDGTFPVYEKFAFQIMRGTNPDGSAYADPVSWVSYFNGGDAVHYFARGSYGFPQSLGCVELPYTQAKASFPYLTYGSLVTVTG
jgi:peptidoglycan hydrolase-like protein with peptidoglycan-binding domain